MELDRAGIGRATRYKYSPDAEAVLSASDLAGEVVNVPAEPRLGWEGVLQRAAVVVDGGLELPTAAGTEP